MAFDFVIYRASGMALLAGHSPYSVAGFFSPPAFAAAMTPFALMPGWLAFALWTAANLAALILLARRRSHLALLFLPALFHLYAGQVDLLILAAGLLGGWPGLALATLKPQLALFLFLYHRHDRRRLLYAAAAALALHMPGLPWLAAWRAATPGVLDYAEHASSLFGLAALTGWPALTFALVAGMAALAFYLVRPDAARFWTTSYIDVRSCVEFYLVRPDGARFWRWAAAFNPVSNIYSMCVLVPALTWRHVVLSWALLPAALWLHTGLPWAALAVL